MADFWTTDGSGDFARIIALSLGVSLSATGLAILIGLPLGASLAVFRFPGRRLLIVIINALLGLPPVVVGLALYLVLSRSGPLGELRLLFTPGAMVLAQAVLATPIVAALAHRALADLWADYGGALRIDGATPLRAIPTLLAWDGSICSWRLSPASAAPSPRLAPSWWSAAISPVIPAP